MIMQKTSYLGGVLSPTEFSVGYQFSFLPSAAGSQCQCMRYAVCLYVCRAWYGLGRRTGDITHIHIYIYIFTCTYTHFINNTNVTMCCAATNIALGGWVLVSANVCLCVRVLAWKRSAPANMYDVAFPSDVIVIRDALAIVYFTWWIIVIMIFMWVLAASRCCFHSSIRAKIGHIGTQRRVQWTTSIGISENKIASSKTTNAFRLLIYIPRRNIAQSSLMTRK